MAALTPGPSNIRATRDDTNWHKLTKKVIISMPDVLWLTPENTQQALWLPLTTSNLCFHVIGEGNGCKHGRPLERESKRSTFSNWNFNCNSIELNID